MRRTVSTQTEDILLGVRIEIAVKDEFYKQDWDFGRGTSGTSVFQLMSIERHIRFPHDGKKRISHSYYRFIYPDRVFTECLTLGDIQFSPVFGLRKISPKEAEVLTGQTLSDFRKNSKIRNSYPCTCDRSPWTEQSFKMKSATK